jgi:hypothetical protein
VVPPNAHEIRKIGWVVVVVVVVIYSCAATAPAGAPEKEQAGGVLELLPSAFG